MFVFKTDFSISLNKNFIRIFKNVYHKFALNIDKLVFYYKYYDKFIQRNALQSSFTEIYDLCQGARAYDSLVLSLSL